MNFTIFAFNHSIKIKKFYLEDENNHICKFTVIQHLKLPNIYKEGKTHICIIVLQSIFFDRTYMGMHNYYMTPFQRIFTSFFRIVNSFCELLMQVFGSQLPLKPLTFLIIFWCLPPRKEPTISTAFLVDPNKALITILINLLWKESATCDQNFDCGTFCL